MKPLNQRNKYKGLKLSGSPKVFYGKYPYKVKLAGNSIIPSWNFDDKHEEGYKKFLEIWDFCEQYPKTVKLLNGWSRYAYFHSKDTFDKFITKFKNQILEVTGPYDKEHCSFLALTNSENYWDYKQHSIRKDNYFKKYDTKLTLRYPHGRHHGSFYGTIHATQSWKDTFKHYRKVGETIKGCVSDGDTRQHQRTVYIKSDDLEDILMILKLKYNDCVHSITSVLVVENL